MPLKKFVLSIAAFLVLFAAAGGIYVSKARANYRAQGVVTLGTAPDGTALFKVWDNSNSKWIYFTSNQVINR